MALLRVVCHLSGITWQVCQKSQPNMAIIHQLHSTCTQFTIGCSPFLSNTIVLFTNAIKIIRFMESIHSVYTIIVFVCSVFCLWHNEVLCSIFYTPLHIRTFSFIITYQVSTHIRCDRVNDLNRHNCMLKSLTLLRLMRLRDFSNFIFVLHVSLFS